MRPISILLMLVVAVLLAFLIGRAMDQSIRSHQPAPIVR